MSNNPYSAVNMTQFGIDIIVLTKHENINKFIKKIKSDIKKGLPYGLTTEILYNRLLSKLKFEDRYFSLNTSAAYKEKQRWQAFNDDCLFFAALDYVISGKPIHLVHPLQYAENSSKSIVNTVKNNSPTLINGIDLEIPKTLLN